MSNYINVLRRLERERRAPQSAPMAPIEPERGVPTEAPVLTAQPEPPRQHIAPVRVEVAPAPTPIPAPPLSIAPAAPRTVVPRPTVALSEPPPVVVPTIVAAPVAAPTVVAAPTRAPTTPPPSSTSGSARRTENARSRAFTSAAHPGIAKLLDGLRLIATEGGVRTIVFSGASTVEAVNALAVNLAHHADTNGMTALVAMLTTTGGRTFVTPTVGFATSAAPLEVELDAGVSTAQVHSWLSQVAPGADLLVITAPPLATTIDGALMACACDGLVIVAESEVTERAALHTAAERARITGCRTLGVVMHGTKDRVPGWIRRLMGDTAEPQLTRED